MLHVRPEHRLSVVTWIAIAVVAFALVVKNLLGVEIWHARVGALPAAVQDSFRKGKGPWKNTIYANLIRWRHGWPLPFAYRPNWEPSGPSPNHDLAGPWLNRYMVWFGAGALTANVVVGVAVAAGAACTIDSYCRRFAIAPRFRLRALLAVIASVACYAALEVALVERHRWFVPYQLRTAATVVIYMAVVLAWLAFFDGALKRVLAGLLTWMVTFWNTLTTRYYPEDVEGG